MSDRPIYLEKQGEIGVLVLNRPEKLNALNQEVWQGIIDLCGEVADDPDIKVLILRGSTPRAFCAGADISEFPVVHANLESATDYHDNKVRKAYDAIEFLAKPTIAMIQGICFGGGCAVAMSCDLRYADRTSRFSIPPAKLGIAYSLHETKHLTDLVGPSKAKEILMGAKVLEAEEAFINGLVTRLFDADELERETFAFAETLCNLSQFTIRGVKTTVHEINQGAVDDNEVSERLQKSAFDGPDYKEGREAFLEKRAPKFTYR